MRKTYSKKQKQEIIEKYYAGMTPTELSKDSGIARSTIYAWLKDGEQKAVRIKRINMREVFDLKQKCEQQEKMIEILQTATCTVHAPLRERYAVIRQLEGKYSVSLLCKTMKVAKGSYYNHILRNKNEDTLAAQKRAELTSVIEQIFHENHEIYGAGKIHAVLKERGYKISPNTVASIMHDNRWFAIVDGAKKLYQMTQERKQNVLNQKFTVTRPNEVWVGNVTYFRYRQQTYYICVILDLFARKVVGYRISLSNSTQLTKGAFKTAFESRQPTELLFHSDQGCNYTSKTYMAYLRQLGVRQSFSKSGTPYDNSVMESFFKSMKTEKLYRIDFRSERELKQAVKEYVYYYNEKRHHSVLHYQTPNGFERKYYSQHKDLLTERSNTGGSD